MRRGSENLERLIGAESDQSQAEPLPSILIRRSLPNASSGFSEIIVLSGA
jgi:hypothetical protein